MEEIEQTIDSLIDKYHPELRDSERLKVKQELVQLMARYESKGIDFDLEQLYNIKYVLNGGV